MIWRPWTRRAALVAPALVAPLALAACAPDLPADDGRIQVLASFYPLQMIAQEVGGERVSVESLTPPGAEPHDVELSPAQVSRVSTSDLVVYLSGFQAAVDDAVEQAEPQRVLDAADVTPLLTADHAQEHAHEGAAEEDEHHHGTLDPHFWLDPTRMPPVVDAVAEHLSDIDPDGAQTYAANAAALNQRFTDLDAQYTSGLAVCELRTIVTTHEAFGYLAHRYDLEEVGISGLDPEAEPSPARLAEVEDIVEEEGVTTIFYESLVSPKVAQTLADDLGIQTAVLDPIESVTEGADYFTVADDNLAALRMALSCS